MSERVTQRTIIRLKHSLKADEEINAVLPDDLERLEREFPELAALVARGAGGEAEVELPAAPSVRRAHEQTSRI